MMVFTEGTPSIFPKPPVSYMSEIRELTERLTSEAGEHLPEDPIAGHKLQPIRVYKNIAYRTVMDLGFFKVKDFWAKNGAKVPVSILKECTWFFITVGTSKIKQGGKIITVKQGDSVYFNVGDTFGDFKFTGSLHGVKVTMASIT